MMHAIRTAPDRIASVEPAAAPGLRGLLVVLEIARERAPPRRLGRVTHEHLARRAVRHVAVPIVDDADVDAGDRLAESPRADPAGMMVVAEDAAELGHAPDLDQRKTEPLLEYGMETGLDAGADAVADGVVAIRCRRRLVQQHGCDDTEIVNGRRSRRLDLRPPAPGIEAIRLHLAATRRNGAEERDDAGIEMIEGQRVVDPILAGLQRRQATEACIPVAASDLVAMGENTALWLSRGAGGVEDLRLARGIWRERGRGYRRTWHGLASRRNVDGRPMTAFGQRGVDLWPPAFDGEDQRRLGVLEKVGRLGGPVIRIDRHAARAQSVERHPMHYMLRAVLHQDRDPGADSIAGGPIGFRETGDLAVRVAIGDLVAAGPVGTLGVRRHGEERPVRPSPHRLQPKLGDRDVVANRRHAVSSRCSHKASAGRLC